MGLKYSRKTKTTFGDLKFKNKIMDTG